MLGRDRSVIWIAFADLLLCMLAIIIVAVNPKTPPAVSPEQQAQHLLSVDWDVAGWDADVDLWLVTPSGKPVLITRFRDSYAVFNSTLKQFTDSFAPEFAKQDIGLSSGTIFNPRNPLHRDYAKNDVIGLVNALLNYDRTVHRHLDACQANPDSELPIDDLPQNGSAARSGARQLLLY